MSPSSTPVPAATALSPSLVLLLLLMLVPRHDVAAEITTTSNGSCDMKSCALLEASLLEEYVSGLNASELPLMKEGSAGNETLPPFGALPSDWSRLLLLQNSQPEGTPLREGLLRLSRLVLAAYFDSQERHEWTDQLLTGDQGRGGDAAAGMVSEAEFEDQQANNATSGSTAQKGSTRINASSIDVAAYNNGGNQPSGGNFSGNEAEDSTTTTSHYSAVLATAEGANFNQTFSSAADNEASGSKSNETFDPTAAAPYLDDDVGSAANEVLHERSREQLHWRYMDDDSGAFSSASDESISEFHSIKSIEKFFEDSLVDEFFATEATANETAAPLEDPFELTSTPQTTEDLQGSDELMAATTHQPIAENPGDNSSSAAGISEEPAARDSGESRKNGDNPERLISGDRSAMPASAAPVADGNRTSDRSDDLFSESTTTTTATTERRPGDDWNSTGSIEPASDGGDSPVAVRLLRSIPKYLLRRESSPAAATAAQPVPPASGDVARASGVGEATTSSRNRRQTGGRRNKRRTRKRAGAEPNAEGQYPSFDGREPGQVLLVGERSAENSARSPQ